MGFLVPNFSLSCYIPNAPNPWSHFLPESQSILIASFLGCLCLCPHLLHLFRSARSTAKPHPWKFPGRLNLPIFIECFICIFQWIPSKIILMCCESVIFTIHWVMLSFIMYLLCTGYMLLTPCVQSSLVFTILHEDSCNSHMKT